MRQLIAEDIDALLPQTQCQKCGFNGCKPYAEAIFDNKADINQCPPGGEKGIQALASLLNVSVKPLNPDYGIEQTRLVAVIIEKDCIGCTKCLPPCPVDAILGGSKQMHTVITSECTGCELCVAPCPVDCIIMQPIQNDNNLVTWNQQRSDVARNRYSNKTKRLARLKSEKMDKIKKQKLALAKVQSKKNISS